MCYFAVLPFGYLIYLSISHALLPCIASHRLVTRYADANNREMKERADENDQTKPNQTKPSVPR